MQPQLAYWANKQHGLVTRRQALEAGYTERELRTLTGHRGRWHTVRRGVYIRREEWESHDARTGQAHRLVLAAHLTMNRDHVISHGSAALLHGLPMLDPRDGLVHITRPGVTGSRTEHAVKHHSAAYSAEQVVLLDGVPALDLARTAVDIGREHGTLHGVVVADAALQLGATRKDLWNAIEPMACWPHVTAARAGIELCDPGAESPGETMLRTLIVEIGLGPVETQFAVPVGDRICYADMRAGRLLFEFDGRAKYRRIDQGGFATADPGELVFAEKVREDGMRGVGFGVARVIWEELIGRRAREATKARLLREYAEATARFGTELPVDWPILPKRVRRAA
ncbi:type IV toxin-antitoxin system AbiEi family antitoxin domain-containing protein [Nocardioides sp. AE5]|uniref:type IV toxin-antitoxin system AbiEi family antitoxin domain-containing protein n=1 Tax=Nocardioides sp. AE5 TaxID=2962573 RepID=UPI0028820DD0|nr:type IV toxin-antitoxin system AbiEi family antitoxin domain-containing protein [Nocardioides sp. AE5]MDT0202581.1 hypothetical protein [Nocardioides sp. AE5]